MTLAPTDYSSVCNTTACHNLSAYVLQSISPEFKTLDPCNNWDKFVCDGYRTTNGIPSFRREMSPITNLNLEVNTVLQTILSSSYPALDAKTPNHSPWFIDVDHVEAKRADAHNFKAAQSFYSSCMHDYNAQKEGYDSLKLFYQQIFGKSHRKNPHPTTEQVYNTQNMTKAFIKMTRRGLNSFVEFGPAKSLLDPLHMTVMIRPQLDLGLERHQYEDKNMLKTYKDLIEMILGNSTMPFVNDSKQLAGTVVELERQAAKLLPSPERQRNLQAPGTVMQVPVGDLEDYVAYLPMAETLQAQPLPGGYDLKTVELLFPEALKSLNKMWLATSIAERMAYMHWQVFLQTEDLWHMSWLHKWKSFRRTMEERSSDLDGSETCVGRTRRQLPHIIDSIFIKLRFSNDSKNLAVGIFNNIKKEYTRMLSSTTWFSPKTRASILSKASSIKANIGFYDADPDITNATALFNFYVGAATNTVDNTTIEAQRHIDTHFNLENWHLKRMWKELGKPPKEHPWVMDAATVNAAYSPQSNGVTLPAGILQFPFFDANVPLLLSYAGYGSIVAHELTHAVDDQSRNFGADGQLGNHGWTEADIKQFDERAQCFSKAYENLASKSSNGSSPRQTIVKGNLVLGESIADAYGADVAFKAWKAATPRGSHEGFPGLEMFTEDQLFWIVRSMSFCSVEKQSFLTQQALTDEHPAMQLRTWMPLMNSRHWHETFGCPIKEPVCDLFGN